jgi:hypothetical protein
MTEVVLEQKSQAAAVSSFGKRNANSERIEQEEAELKKLIDQNNKPDGKTEDDNVDDSNLSAEEKTFKKRYGDLRRHSQQQQTQLQAQIDELRTQLTQSTEKQIKLPKSEEELSAWASQYPDVAKIVETIALKKIREENQEVKERMKTLDEREAQAARDKAEAELMHMHPDFDKIRDTDEFHDWVEDQPKWVQNALYENDTDAKAAARAIDLYKSDMGKKNKPPRTTYDRDVAQSVGTRRGASSPSNGDEAGVIYESAVNKMTSQQYEKNQEAIQKAIQSGKFVYDISGNAR